MMTALSKQILESMPLGLVAIDNELTILRYNETAAKIMGQPMNLVLGRNIDEVFLPRQGERMIQLTVEQDIEFTDYEVQLHLGDGVVWMLINTRRMVDASGRVVGATMVFSDITAIKEMELQLVRSARLVTIGEMAAGAVHEIRNPLTVIKGFLQLWSLEHQHPYLPLILGEVEQIDSIIGQFLQLSKKQLQTEACKSDFDLQVSIDTLGKLFGSEAILKGVELQMEREAAQMPVRMNHTEWKQILANLVRNAFDSFPAEQEYKLVSIHLRKRRRHAAVFITDNGTGIPKHVLQQVRSAFFTTKESGTGLGLNICEHLAARNGCRFQIFSQEERGTVVVLQVPLTVEASVAATVS